MAYKGPKRESLSRYFKDLDECEGSSDESDDEINNVEKLSSTEKNNLKSQNTSSGKPNNTNSSSSSSTTSTSNKTASESSEKKPADDKCDADLGGNRLNKLPSASECLNTKSNPRFLKLLEKKEVNWDSCQKRLGGESDEEGTTDFKSNAVPPPSTYEPITDPGIKVVDSEGRKRKLIGDDLEDQMTSTKAYKVHKENDDNDAADDCT